MLNARKPRRCWNTDEAAEASQLSQIASTGRVYHALLMVANTGRIFLAGKTEKKLERDFPANRLKIDRLNRAYYGLTFDELIKLTIQLPKQEEGDDNASGA